MVWCACSVDHLDVKYAVFKVAGRRVYDEVGVPVTLGIVAGEMLGTILVSTMSTIDIVRFVAQKHSAPIHYVFQL